MTLYFPVDFQNTTKNFFFQSRFLVTVDSLLNCEIFCSIATYIPVR